MEIKCPSCGKLVTQNSSPIRGPANDGSEVWLCMKCPAMVCSYPTLRADGSSNTCYVQHNMDAHPELYQPHKRPSGGGKKNRKHKR